VGRKASGLSSDDVGIGQQGCQAEATPSGVTFRSAKEMQLNGGVAMLSASLSRYKQQKRRFHFFTLCFISTFVILLLSPVYSHTAHAADVTLEWDPNPEPDIAGYEVYYGVSSRDYSEMIDVGDTTICTIGNLDTGVTYYFAAKAYNTSGYRSDYSDEVTYTPAESVADISIDPDTHYFGNVMVGDVSDATFTVINDGIADLNIGIIGGLSAPFSIVTDNCSGETISQSSSRTFAIRFAPTTDASFDDTISIPSDDPDENPLAIILHGTGTSEPIENQPPVADAGSNQTVNEGTTVTLDGSESDDFDGMIVSYQWTQTGGKAATLSDTTDVTPTFVTPPVDTDGATLAFQLTVMDNGGLEATNTVTVEISDNGITSFSDDVITTTLSSGDYIGFKEDSGKLVSLYVIESFRLPADAGNLPSDFDPNDLIDMQIKVPMPGDETTITVYLENPAPEESILYYYSRIDDLWSDYSDNVEFNAARDQVKITLEDGGIGDDDGVENGIIVDPFAFALSSEPMSEESDSSPSDGGGCFIGSVACANSLHSGESGVTKNPQILLLILFSIIVVTGFRKAIR